MMKKTKYFILEGETKSEIAGVWPQTTIKNLTKEKLDIIDSFSAHDLPAVMPDFTNLCFDRDAVVTDFVSNNFFDESRGVFFNEKIKAIIDDCTLFNSDFIVTSIEGKRNSYPYFFLYIRDSLEIIDFSQSTFCAGDILNRPQSSIFKLNSIDEFKEKRNSISETIVGGDVLFLSVCLKYEIDILRIPHKSPIYISEKLCKKLLDEQVSGFYPKKSKIDFFVMNK